MVKISGLPAATTPLAGTEELAIVQGGETRKVDAADLGLGEGGQAGINYIENPDFEVNTNGWTVTGVSMTFAVVSGASNTLRGTQSGQFTNTGGLDAEDEYVAYRFTIDNADLLKVLSIGFDYHQTSTNENYKVQVVADPLGTPVVIYDSGPITPADYGRFADYFSTTDETSYELRIVRIVSAGGLRPITIDNVRVGPQEVAIGPNVGDWISAGPLVIEADTTNPTKGATTFDEVWYRRVGDSCEVHASFHQSGSGSNGSGVYEFLLPDGITIDTAKVNTDDTRGRQAFGIAVVNDERVGSVYYGQSDRVRVTVTDDGSSGEVGSSLFGLGAAGRGYGLHYTVPVSGWGANAPVSPMTQPWLWSERFASTASRVTTTPTRLGEYRSIGNGVDGVPGTLPSASDGMLLSGNNAAIPEVNLWEFYVGTGLVVELQGMWGATGRTDSYSTNFHNSGAGYFGPTLAYDDATGVAVVSCRRGGSDRPAFRVDGTGGVLTVTDAYFDLLVTPKTNPLALTSEALVHVEAQDDTGQAVTADVTDFSYATVSRDTHGAWSGTVFTAPRAGTYLFCATSTNNSTGATQFSSFINGTKYARGTTVDGNGETEGYAGALTLAQGDQVSFRQNQGSTRSAVLDQNTLSITEIR